MNKQTAPFSARKADWFFVGFFLLNLFFITYIVDIEQLIIPDPAHFQYPAWPPAPFVDMGIPGVRRTPHTPYPEPPPGQGASNLAAKEACRSRHHGQRRPRCR